MRVIARDEFKYGLSKRLLDIRTQLGLTQIEFANMLGIWQTTYASWENRNRFPDIETLFTVAERLNVNVQYLMGLTNASGNVLDDNKYVQIPLLKGEEGITEFLSFPRIINGKEVFPQNAYFIANVLTKNESFGDEGDIAIYLCQDQKNGKSKIIIYQIIKQLAPLDLLQEKLNKG